MSIDDINDKKDILIVNIPDTKTKNQRTFTITEQKISGINVIDIYKKYISLRPLNMQHKRFFLNYNKGKCTVQPIGKNSLPKFPSTIAQYLKLPEPELYTGHSLRRTSASLLVDAGADLLSLKRHGAWKSTTVAEGYLEESISKKCKISNQIFGGNENSSMNSGNFTESNSSTDINVPKTTTMRANQILRDATNSTTTNTDKYCSDGRNGIHEIINITGNSTLTSNAMDNFNVSSSGICARGVTFSNLHNCTINISSCVEK